MKGHILLLSLAGQAVITLIMLIPFLNFFGHPWGLIHLLILNAGIFTALFIKLRSEKAFKCIYCGTPFFGNDFGSSCKKCSYTLLPKEYRT